MESGDIISDTKKFCETCNKKYKTTSGVIMFNCILRTLELRNKKLTNEYANLFSNIPMIGFSTYGEAYIGHINQTAIFLILE